MYKIEKCNNIRHVVNLMLSPTSSVVGRGGDGLVCERKTENPVEPDENLNVTVPEKTGSIQFSFLHKNFAEGYVLHNSSPARWTISGHSLDTSPFFGL